jgi:hypothetical protein
MPIVTGVSDTHYRILIVRSYRFLSAQLFAFSIKETLPNFTIPLQKGEEEIELNLQNLLLGIYERARFNLTLDYHISPVPDLLAKDREWMDILLKEQGRRE